MSHLVALKKEALFAKHHAAHTQSLEGNDSDGSRSDMPVSRKSTRPPTTLTQKHMRLSAMSGSGSGELKYVPVMKAPNNWEGIRVLLYDKISLLLLFYPFGIASRFLDWGDSTTFWLNFMSMIPLAKIMGDATEELAAGLKSDTIGGLLNATFGNAVEMILSAVSLSHGLLEVVKATLLGSVLSNMLLVLGMSFLLGGLTPQNGTIKLRELNFQAQGALVNMAMLLLACMSFALPTVFLNSTSGSIKDALVIDLQVSRACSVLVLTSYIAYLIFQLYTHIGLFDDEEAGEDDNESSSLTVGFATGLLVTVTVLVSISSELLVDAIGGVVEQCGLGEQFIGIILLPLIGNACEHASAVRFAIQDRPALSIGIAVGSSTQIALLVVPFSVLAGWGMGQPMDLNFHPLNTCVLVLAVLIVLSIVSDGRAHWIEGYMLCIAYAVISVLYWFVPSQADKFQMQ